MLADHHFRITSSPAQAVTVPSARSKRDRPLSANKISLATHMKRLLCFSGACFRSPHSAKASHHRPDQGEDRSVTVDMDGEHSCVQDSQWPREKAQQGIGCLARLRHWLLKTELLLLSLLVLPAGSLFSLENQQKLVSICNRIQLRLQHSTI